MAKRISSYQRLKEKNAKLFKESCERERYIYRLLNDPKFYMQELIREKITEEIRKEMDRILFFGDASMPPLGII